MLAVVLVGFAYQLCRTGPDTGMAAGMVPHLAGPDSLLLATGIVGATVMPHAIYLHSGLTRHGRTAGDRAAAVRASRLDIGAALGVAGLVNAAMLVVAAAAFHRPGHAEAGASLTAAHAGLGARSGPVAAAAFGLALLAAGLASATVGTYAGQLVMRGFLRRSVPVLLRRLVTMAPALVVLGAGADPSRALVLSQVVLSFGIPAALIPLLLMTRRRDVMGELANRRATTLAGIGVTTLIVTLNAVLLLQVLS
jgi:manganese transport protein